MSEAATGAVEVTIIMEVKLISNNNEGITEHNVLYIQRVQRIEAGFVESKKRYFIIMTDFSDGSIYNDFISLVVNKEKEKLEHWLKILVDNKTVIGAKMIAAGSSEILDNSTYCARQGLFVECEGEDLVQMSQLAIKFNMIGDLTFKEIHGDFWLDNEFKGGRLFRRSNFTTYPKTCFMSNSAQVRFTKP